MSTEQHKNEDLIRWLEGDLSGAELSAFEASAEFEDYKKILDAADGMEVPTMDEDAVFSSIKEKIAPRPAAKKKGKIVPLRRWMIGVAAVSILAFTVMALWPNYTNVSSGIGQFVSHTLPDGSEINLNGNSQIRYNSNFEKERTLHLSGEAFFDVKKGETFAVKTNQGLVQVLGTSFNVFSRNDIFIVSCKTGKVKVESSKKSVILEKGERIRFEDSTTAQKEKFESANIGKWVEGESYFSGASLQQVTLSLNSIYGVELNLPKEFQSKRFTGSFVHSDLKKALKMVFSPMGIAYSIDEEGKVLFSE